MKWLKSFPLTLLCTAVIAYLCFFTPPRTSLDDVPLIDKWTHLAMYIFYTLLIGVEYHRMALRERRTAASRHERRRYYALCVLWPVAMGGLIEILQANCTGGRRSGEWTDFIADTLGVLLGWLLCRQVVKLIRR